jgi:glucose/arabinose dehydrogenase
MNIVTQSTVESVTCFENIPYKAEATMFAAHRHQLSFKYLLALTFCYVFLIVSVNAASLPAGFNETPISGLSSPTAMEFAPDGRLFVCLQGGALRVIKNGTLLPTPFVSLSVDFSGERGLLGIAFDPNFASNNFVYVYYTVSTTPRHNRVSRFTANGDVAAPSSEVVLLDLDNLSTATNHNGGAMHFGPDGKLYVAVGENANGSNSQTLSNLLGKMLRINSDGSIPSDNPFFNTATGNNRAIWALGLRNPFTFAFQPGTTRMFINDVGQSTWEEINDGIAGSNYGWPTTEGATSNPAFRSPLFFYGHGTGATTGCAIAGGTFYNPLTVQFPASFVGQYFFADLCSGWIRVFDPVAGTASGFASGIGSPVDLKVSADGSLYYLSIGSSSVFRVSFASNGPNITTQPTNQSVLLGQTATFSVTASGSAPLGFQWQRNMNNIQGAISSSYTTPATVLTDTGAKFRCVVTNTSGSATSNEATLTVTAPAPVLMTEENSDIAVALDSAIFLRDPFPILNLFNFSADQRTRIMLFGANLELLPNETTAAITAKAEDAQLNVFPMTVEFVGKPVGMEPLTEVVAKLPENLPMGQSVFVSVTLRGQTSNKVRVRISGN